MNEQELINEFNQIISNKYSDFKGIYFFGSRFKGNHKEDSDIDLVFIFDQVDKQKKDTIYDALSDLMYKYDIFIDAHIMTPEKLKFNPFFYEEVVNRGQFNEAA